MFSPWLPRRTFCAVLYKRLNAKNRYRQPLLSVSDRLGRDALIGQKPHAVQYLLRSYRQYATSAAQLASEDDGDGGQADEEDHGHPSEIAHVTDDRQAANAFDLRPYQKEAIQACLDAIDEGSDRIGVSLPTASGKTIIFLALIRSMRNRTGHQGQGSRYLLLVPNLAIAEQTVKKAREHCDDGVTIELEQRSNKA